MRFDQKLKSQQHDQIWDEYCGFLKLDLKGFMALQRRLLLEQIQLWSNCPLGEALLKGRKPQTIEEFREIMPLTTYKDYADILLQKQESMLPAPPVIWIETTWEGGKHPVKAAPYTKSMLNTYQSNMMGSILLATSPGEGQFTIRPGDKMLYGLAPLPYATGILPLLLDNELYMEFLPPVKLAEKMSFGERNKKGFQLGLQKGIDFFFGVASVTYFVSQSLNAASTGGKSGGVLDLAKFSPAMLCRLAAAKHRSKKTGEPIKPKDVFKLKGFVCAGTDARCYKDDLEDLWGIRPMEIAAGTESTCIGTETRACDGLHFFPDACFYEFIPEDEMSRSLDDPSYQPKAYLMDEILPNNLYELVITVLKGGAFARYRIGDVYRCLGSDKQGGVPRFAFVDRIPTVIDIAGFTRITENSIGSVMALSGLGVYKWVAAKEFNENGRPFLHVYVEMQASALVSSAVSQQILKEHLGVYFKYVDSDYKDLKKILGMDPLMVTILRVGTFDRFYKKHGKNLRAINPPVYELRELLHLNQEWGVELYG